MATEFKAFVVIILLFIFIFLIVDINVRMDDGGATPSDEMVYLEEVLENQAYIINKIPEDKPQVMVNTTTNTFFSISDEAFIEEARKRYMDNHEWTESTDCSVLTQEFTVIMKEFGIEMYKVHVFNDNDAIGHTYNCIPYDVQSGVYNEAWDSYSLVRTTYNYGDYQR